jgi:hypothetical protein
MPLKPYQTTCKIQLKTTKILALQGLQAHSEAFKAYSDAFKALSEAFKAYSECLRLVQGRLGRFLRR